MPLFNNNTAKQMCIANIAMTSIILIYLLVLYIDFV